MANYQHCTKEKTPQEREVKVDMSTNYAIAQPIEVPFNFPPNYELKNMLQSSISVFNRLSLERPRNSTLNFLLHLEIGNRDHLSLKDKMNLFMTTYLRIFHLRIGVRRG